MTWPLTLVCLPFVVVFASMYWRMLCRWAPPDDKGQK